MNLPHTPRWSRLLAGLLLWPAVTLADQNDERLDALFQQLQEADTAVAAYPVEAEIWTIWHEHADAQVQSLLLQGIAQMNADNLRGALAIFDRLVVQAPDFAEGWNKRATVHYLLGNQKASEADIEATLALEPFHFGALSGLGLVCLAQGEYFRARRAFLSVLEVYPAMSGVKQNLQALEQMLDDRAI
jgi:Flp pilus assembly protein TadD